MYVCSLGSDTVRANVLPLEQICGLLGQMGLTIASGPKTQQTVPRGSLTLAVEVDASLKSRMIYNASIVLLFFTSLHLIKCNNLLMTN